MIDCDQNRIFLRASSLQRHWRQLLWAGLACAVGACSSEQPGTHQEKKDTLPIRGFVLTGFNFDLPGSMENDCPEGFNLTERELAIRSLSSNEREVFEEDARQYLDQAVPLYHEDPSQDPCATPESFPDPGLLTIDTPVELRQFDPDLGVQTDVSPEASQCAADATNGKQREVIRNQLWRAVGCIKGFQPGGQIEDFADVNIRNGSRTILMELHGMSADADADEGEVEVRIFSSGDPAPTGASGQLLRGASLFALSDRRYQNQVSGQLKNGVIITEIFDLRLKLSGQRVESEYFLRDARLQLNLKDDGTVSGHVAGHYDLAAFTHGYIRYQDATGRSSGGAGADTLGYSCRGLYHAVQRFADGHPDTRSGKCTSISTVFNLQAIPAFVLHSTNVTMSEGVIQ